MMQLTAIIEPLECTLLHEGAGFSDATLDNVVASDLMSDVLVVDQRHLLLVTSLASDQVIRTADIVGAVAVLATNGKTLPSNMLVLAREMNMTLLRSPLTKFMACVRLGRLMNLS